MGVSPGMTDPGDRGAYYVYDPQDQRAVLLCFFDGDNGVGGLAALRDRDDHITRMDDGIAIAELRCVLYFHGYTAELFEYIFRHKPGMPAGAAADHNNTVGGFQFIDVLLDARHGDRPPDHIQTAAKTVKDGIGLFKDLLQHKVLVPSLFDGCHLQVELLDERCDLLVSQVLED